MRIRVDRGVSLVGGVDVTDPDLLLDLLAEGALGYHFFGKAAERIVMEPLALHLAANVSGTNLVS